MGRPKTTKGTSAPEHKQDNAIITAYSETGQRIIMPKSEWRARLPKMFEEFKDKPEELYKLLVISLKDGFFEECIEPARTLYETDKDKERSTNILGIVLMKNELLDEAEKVLEGYLQEEGGSGVILTNLAKVYYEKGDKERGNDTLWRALKADPNQDNAMELWYSIHHEKGEEEKAYASIEELSRIRGSYLPQAWLGRRLLEKQDVKGGLERYREALKAAPGKGYVLMFISGDLGTKGYVKEIMKMVYPIYDPRKHGHQAAINLIIACTKLKEKEKGLKICHALEKQGRADIKQRLKELREELEKIKD